MKKRFLAALATGLLVVGLGGISQAAPIAINAILTGDIRDENPDNIFINVTITGDTESNITNWVIDLDMADEHPLAKLDEFYFNLADGIIPTFGGFNPVGWAVLSPANTQGGGNITTFMFEALDPQGDPNADDVTNFQNLTFTATLTTNWLQSMFFGADYASSSNTELGAFQLAAHVQGLVPDGEDSGFATGNYAPVPEPATMLLFGAGLAGLAGVSRRKKKA